MSSRSRLGPLWGLPLALLGAFVLVSMEVGAGFAIPVAMAGSAAAAIILRGPVGKALARRLEGDQGSVAPPSEEVMLELDDLRARVLELEERVDFSERLLATHREQSRVAGGAE